MRCQNAVILRHAQHYHRFTQGCLYFGWEPLTFEAFHTLTHQAAQTTPNGAFSLHYSPQEVQIHPKALDPNHALYQKEGISLLKYPQCFPDNYRGYGGAKTNDRVYYNQAKVYADEQGVPEVLLCQEDGHIVEGYRTNIFAVIEGVLTTPDASVAVRGTMQAWIIEQALLRGVPCKMRPIHQEELMNASELFVTNALIGCWPVREYAGKQYLRSVVMPLL